MPTNDFLPFGSAVGANVLSQSDYVALDARSVGFSAGTAVSKQLNKAWRQSSVMAASVAQFIANRSGNDVLDNGNLTTIQNNLELAVKAAVAAYVPYASQSGTNDGTATNTVVCPATLASSTRIQAHTAFTTTGTATAQILTPAPGIALYAANQRFCVKFNVNAGADPTINVSGLGPVFIKQYNSLGAKVAGKFTANQIADIVFDGTDFVMIDQLPYGDFGMGLLDGGTVISNANNLTATGVYRVGPTWTGSPYTGTAGENQGSVFHRSCFDDTTYELQIFQSMITDDLLFRKKASNVWQPWVTVISSSNLLGNLFGIGQTGGGVVVTDADALTATGIYTVGPSWTGSPYSGVNGLNQGSVFNRSSFSGSTYEVQMFQGMTSDDVKFRRKTAGVWQPWVTMYHTGNLGPALVPTGAVSYMATTTVPNGFIKRNGAAVSRTTYAALFAVIGTTFGAGDGSTTFNVPDARGEFDRGWDDSRGIDPGRAFGSLQLDSFASHTHPQDTRTILGVAGAAAQVGGSNGTNGGVTQATGGSETRPRNVAYMAVIKY